MNTHPKIRYELNIEIYANDDDAFYEGLDILVSHLKRSNVKDMDTGIVECREYNKLSNISSDMVFHKMEREYEAVSFSQLMNRLKAKSLSEKG